MHDLHDCTLINRAYHLKWSLDTCSFISLHGSWSPEMGKVRHPHCTSVTQWQAQWQQCRSLWGQWWGQYVRSQCIPILWAVFPLTLTSLGWHYFSLVTKIPAHPLMIVSKLSPALAAFTALYGHTWPSCHSVTGTYLPEWQDLCCHHWNSTWLMRK